MKPVVLLLSLLCSALNRSYKSVKVEETYTNKFVDASLGGLDVR